MAQNVVVPPFDVAPETVVGPTPQSVFAFDFPFWEADDIVVLVDGLSLSGGFTVEGYFVQNGEPVEGGYGSGQVTLNAPVANCTVTIDRFVKDERRSQFSRAAPLGMPPLNADFNKATARDQDLKRRVIDASLTADTALALAQELSSASILPRVTVANIVALKALIPGLPPFVRMAARNVLGDNGAGDFEWVPGDQSANVTRDPGEGVWVAPAFIPSGVLGAWRRVYSGPVLLDWFSGVDPTGATGSKDGLQRAFNSGFPLYAGTPGAIYVVSADGLSLPSNITIEDVRIRRQGYNDGWLLKNSTAGLTQDNANITLRRCQFEDDGLTSGRGNMLKMDGVKRLTIEDCSVFTSSPLTGSVGAWSAFIAGEDIRIAGWRVDSHSAGLYGDGMHFGQVRRLVMDDFHIQAGDDAIALHFPPDSYGYLDGASKDIVIGNGYVSSTDANGIRIGAYGVASGLASSTACRWENVLFNNITFGPCKGCISIYDNRAPAEISAQNTDITFDGMNLGDQANTRLIWIAGNPNTEVAGNYTQHNFRDVTLRNIKGRQAQGQLITGGGADRVVMENVDLMRSQSAPVTSVADVWLRQIDEVVLRDVNISTSEPGTAIYFNYVKELTSYDGVYTNANNAFSLITLGRPTEHGVKARFIGGYQSSAQRMWYSTGTGTIDEFVVDGVLLGTFSSDTSITSAGVYIYRPVGSLRMGNGSPEGVISAPRGALWERRDGGAGTTLYVKETASGASGWVPMRSYTSPFSGTTANRPASVSPGQEYFDTSLGKPVWFKSTGIWVDATGATV